MKTYAHGHAFTRVTKLPVFYVFLKHPVDTVESQRCAFLNLEMGSFIAAAASHCKVTGGPFRIR